MLYKPRNPQFINAVKFTGYVTDELQKLGVQNIPSMMGQCQCGRPMGAHGVINNQLICPDTYIMYEGRQVTQLMSAENFEKLYKPICEEVIDAEEVNENKES